MYQDVLQLLDHPIGLGRLAVEVPKSSKPYGETPPCNATVSQSGAGL
jgi:hypothetical protein